MKTTIALAVYAAWMLTAFAAALFAQADAASSGELAPETLATGSVACILLGFFLKQMIPVLREAIRKSQTDDERAKAMSEQAAAITNLSEQLEEMRSTDKQKLASLVAHIDEIVGTNQGTLADITARLDAMQK